GVFFWVCVKIRGVVSWRDVPQMRMRSVVPPHDTPQLNFHSVVIRLDVPKMKIQSVVPPHDATQLNFRSVVIRLDTPQTKIHTKKRRPRKIPKSAVLTQTLFTFIITKHIAAITIITEIVIIIIITWNFFWR